MQILVFFIRKLARILPSVTHLLQRPRAQNVPAGLRDEVALVLDSGAFIVQTLVADITKKLIAVEARHLAVFLFALFAKARNFVLLLILRPVVNCEASAAQIGSAVEAVEATTLQATYIAVH